MEEKILEPQYHSTPTIDIVDIDPENIKPVEKYLDHADIVANDVSTRRHKLMEKIESAVDSITFDFNTDSPRDVEKKLAAVKMYTDILESREKTAERRVNQRLKVKQADSTENLGKVVVELLKTIDPRKQFQGADGPKDIPDEDLKELESLAASIEVSDTVLRTDAFDLT